MTINQPYFSAITVRHSIICRLFLSFLCGSTEWQKMASFPVCLFRERPNMRSRALSFRFNGEPSWRKRDRCHYTQCRNCAYSVVSFNRKKKSCSFLVAHKTNYAVPCKAIPIFLSIVMNRTIVFPTSFPIWYGRAVVSFFLSFISLCI